MIYLYTSIFLLIFLFIFISPFFMAYTLACMTCMASTVNYKARRLTHLGEPIFMMLSP